MPTVTVPLKERSYDVIIESGSLGRIDTLPLPPEIAILSNQTVAPLYADSIAGRLQANHRITQFNEPDGEAYKCAEWVNKAHDALADFGLTRRGAVLAVGGGVVGDWAGYVAATWMRGVPFVQVPTTLLAMVDSSVGGKTGINHPRAKNLIGAFHQPSRVVIDPDCLKTLPPRELRAGLAEVIKYGVIADAEFFAWLEENLDAALQLDTDALIHIIERSVQIKAEVVGEDERESDAIGRRAILNYGHTTGHAIEAITRYGEYLHGEAIAIGMTVAARLSLQNGHIEASEGADLLQRQTRLFQRAGLPTEMPAGAGFDDLWRAMTLDKKSRGNSVNFILPTRLGDVALFDSVPPEKVSRALSD